ncbi:DUF4917 family protein [Bradyrhizobium huanghuaihaiense]|uniref:DUF4917 family protein n=1 Tax=Bradyrhizobium huanghuaihaiense TaxID=990078 RepID=UPI0021AA6A86|nr:DUF4917 family protein [Bradyrhizobium sp. CB3035]UWU77463.1 DUF4917 family protein [Bradyrhizobium sp. CB3035]
MPATKVITFDEAIARDPNSDRWSLLLGNGFSSRYFNYRSLLDNAELEANDPVRVLFERLKTVDFERVVNALEGASVVEAAYNNKERVERLLADAGRVREALVHAIRAIHPAHREDIADIIPSCVAFLSCFSRVFTLNYDLLLNWVSLDDGAKLPDGFGLGEQRAGFQGPFKIGAYCSIYNLHGALHLFRSGGDVEKRIAGSTGVIDAIAQTITEKKRLPIYIAEGTSLAKMARIRSNNYLSHCYEQLCASSGLFLVFGHSAAPNDAHIYNALFRSNIEHLYFCVYQPTKEKLQTTAGELARYKLRAGSKIEYTFVDAESAHVWDRPPAINSSE